MSQNAVEEMISKRRKELFGDCALIEIIHLHECLRGALKALEHDVNDLASAVATEKCDQALLRVAGRFKVIWSVFRAHSSAEDEFIWPALQSKTEGRISNCKYKSGSKPVIEQTEYEEDHENEERMFSEMDTLLTKLRDTLMAHSWNDSSRAIAQEIKDRTQRLSQHLMAHLEKEETQCMPLVVQHLSKNEIHELVGNIMGKRSADTIAQIMTMAVQNLDEADQEEMVKYMKQSMAGTFFDRWLAMSGWWGTVADSTAESESTSTDNVHLDRKRNAVESTMDIAVENREREHFKRYKLSDELEESLPETVRSRNDPDSNVASRAPAVNQITSQAELEKLIRAIASNSALTPEQKSTTIQGLRDSVWKSNQRARHLHESQPATVVNSVIPVAPTFPSKSSSATEPSPVSTVGSSSRLRRGTPPSIYYKKSNQGKVVMMWNSDSCSTRAPEDGSVPLFSAAELAPTYHDGAAGSVLGCPHYSCACKLRHPKSGRLYTCRLCCEQQRELPMRDQDAPLDRYEVTEVMCMVCNALQPAEDRCINPDCESRGKPFAKYFCRICHLYDDSSRQIFHCPYCNVCRLGQGLGIDFRHCMRCNACVSLRDDDHKCIPQKLQGDCPICNDSLFLSTKPLKGLNCGHVMHLSCFTEYRRGHSYTCPLCMKSMEDMKDYFAMLDSAVRMQPMPDAYLSTYSNIYCQDCFKTGQVRYHFVGQKCPHCGSYNTREMGRVQVSPPSVERAE